MSYYGGSFDSSATFTPAASSHTAPASVGGAKEFTNVGFANARIMITDASIRVDGGTAEGSAFRLYLFNVTPPSALADTGSFVLASGDRSAFLGFIDLGTPADIGDTLWAQVSGINMQRTLRGTSLFAYLVNLTTVTPAAVDRVVTLHTIAL